MSSASGDGNSEHAPLSQNSESDLERGHDPRSPRSGKGNRPRDRLKREAEEKARRVAEAAQKKKDSDSEMNTCLAWICLLGCFALLVGVSGWLAWFIYDYYEGVDADRQIVDAHSVVVSEQFIDYKDPLQRQVNCTNAHSCGNWNCSYVEEHFHKRREFSECDYEDNVVLVSAALIGLSICCVCNILNEVC